MRVRADERAALARLAASLNTTPSRVLRRLLREALTGGPDYFEDGLVELRGAHQALASVGRNINQLARAANSDKPVVSKDLRRNLAAAKLQVERLADVYRAAVSRVQQRTVRRSA